MKFKYQKYLPRLIITREMIQAFQDNDYQTLHALIDLKPWEFSPLNVHLREPLPGQTPADFRGDPWRSSWWKMMALREKLEELAAREGIKPRAAAQLSTMR